MAAAENPFHRFGILRLARESAIQINQMQPFAPGIDKGPGLGCRVIIENSGRIHLPPEQADAGTAFEINRGIEDHDGLPFLLTRAS